MARGPDYQPEFHEKPRISANELARFMLAGNTGKLGIIKRVREKGTAAGVRYSDARDAIRLALCDPAGETRQLNDAANRFRQREKDTALSTFMRADAEKSIDVLNALSLMRNQYASGATRPGLGSRPTSRSIVALSLAQAAWMKFA